MKDLAGNYGDYEVAFDEDGDMRVFPVNAEAREMLSYIVEDNGIRAAELDVLDQLVYGGFTVVDPADIVALTDANILAYGENMWSDINYYQIRSFVDDMIEQRYCYFYKV